MTPLMAQWQALKQQVGDAWLFFRLGDFYELFGDDALEAAPVLDVQLTSRDGTTPMCGVPYHALDLYLERALKAGRSVAIAEQLEDPAAARGLVARGVVRTVTPGTYVPSEREPDGPCVAIVDRGDGVGLAAVWLAEGRAQATEYHGRDRARVVSQLWETLTPAECLTAGWIPPGRVPTRTRPDLFMGQRAYDYLVERLRVPSLTASGLEGWPLAQEALAALLRYVDETQGRTVRHVTHVTAVVADDTLHVSPGAARQLSVEREDEDDLLRWLDLTVTPMGRRTLRTWIRRPLADPGRIAERLDRVDAWYQARGARARFRETALQTADVERAVARLALGLGTPRDLARLAATLARAPVLDRCARDAGLTVPVLASPAISALAEQLAVLDPEPPQRWDGGGLVRAGARPDLDALRRMAEDSRGVLLELEQALKAETGLKSLKIGHHRTLGYYLEVADKEQNRVPNDWRRRQSLPQHGRWTCERLEEAARQIAQAEWAWTSAEEAIGQELVARVIDATEPLAEWARAVGELDAWAALAEAADRYRLVKPTWHDAGFVAEGVRHPLVERTVDSYVPSDLELTRPQHVALITGPNMAGKSTFMRAVALNAWLHHIGSFVAASRWAGPPLKGLYTRVGADDHLTRGQSTFMVEMEETAFLLRHAGADALVLLDELGRGTSTLEGLAIAWAVAEHVAREAGPYTLFATHFRELAEIAAPSVVRWRVDAREVGGQLVLLHRVEPGVASRAYGTAVALRAGLPRSVIQRAERLLRLWEREGRPMPPPPTDQLSWFEPDPVADAVLGELQRLSLDTLTPLDALNLLARWQEAIRG